MVEAFTHGPAVVEPKKHGKFSMFGDNITGEFTNLVSVEFLLTI